MYFQKTTRRFSKYYFRHSGKQFLPFFLKNMMKAWGNLPFSLRRENTENAVANATRVHPWDVKNKTGSRVQTIPRDIPSSTDVPVLLLNHSIFKIASLLYPSSIGFQNCSIQSVARGGWGVGSLNRYPV